MWLNSIVNVACPSLLMHSAINLADAKIGEFVGAAMHRSVEESEPMRRQNTPEEQVP